MNVETKDRIASRFLEYPVLHMMVRAVLFSLFLRFSLLVLFFGSISGGLFISKIWKVTPDWVTPPLRISGLDWIQSISLGRTARAEIDEGQIHDGMTTETLAIANNPGNRRLVRHFLESILAHAQPPEFQGPAIAQSFWFMQLTATNLTDVELPIAVFHLYGLDQFALQILEPHRQQLTPPLQRAFLRALFEGGYFSDFDAYWRLNHLQALDADPEAQIYRAGFDFGWGGASERARTILATSMKDPERQVLAQRVYLRAVEARSEVDEYFTTLGDLDNTGNARLIDHVRGWRLLSGNGQHERALELARSFAANPVTGLETVQLAQAYEALGLESELKDLLNRFTPQFSYLDGLWVMYGDLLADSGQWDEARRFALRIRLDRGTEGRLACYSYFLEGRADLVDHLVLAADQAFSKASQTRPDNLELAVMVARQLRALGRATPARTLLESVGDLGEMSPAYWELVEQVAMDLKDSDLLLKAASQQAALDPENLQAIHNRAAALLIAGKTPQSAIVDTFEVLRQFPDLLEAKLNHAMALVQNHRANEADALLATLPASEMNETQRAYYQLACFETLLEQGRYNLAGLALSGLNSNYLFPSQLARMEKLRARLVSAPEFSSR